MLRFWPASVLASPTQQWRAQAQNRLPAQRAPAQPAWPVRRRARRYTRNSAKPPFVSLSVSPHRRWPAAPRAARPRTRAEGRAHDSARSAPTDPRRRRPRPPSRLSLARPAIPTSDPSAFCNLGCTSAASCQPARRAECSRFSASLTRSCQQLAFPGLAASAEPTNACQIHEPALQAPQRIHSER